MLDYLSQPNDESLFNELRSFKYLASNDQDSAPRITCSAKKPLSILTFNGQWVSDHCFRNDGNLHGGAYRLCVSSNEVRRLEKERKRLVAAYNETLNAAEITKIIEDAESVAKDIGVTKRGPYWKAFKESGPLEDLSE